MIEWRKSYVHGKLREVIYSLAVGPDDIRKRLFYAHQGFAHIKKTQFPEELQADWEWVIKQLTKFGPAIYFGTLTRGSVEMTCNRIRKQTGVKIAQKILDIYLYLDNK